ncbi:hypothetical protein BJX65DRAFT_110238 [Aspergillus insuetus]
MISTSSFFLLFSCTKSLAGQVELVVIYGYTSARLHAFGHKFETQIRAIRTNKSLKMRLNGFSRSRLLSILKAYKKTLKQAFRISGRGPGPLTQGIWHFSDFMDCDGRYEFSHELGGEQRK